MCVYGMYVPSRELMSKKFKQMPPPQSPTPTYSVMKSYLQVVKVVPSDEPGCLIKTFTPQYQVMMNI